MADHPTPEVLHRWLEGRLPRNELRSLVGHLLGGCAPCRVALAEWDFVFTGAEPTEPAGTGDGAPDAYDLALQRAGERVRLHGVRAREIQLASARLHRRLSRRGWSSLSLECDEPVAIFEALLARAWELRHEDPQEMLHLARIAVWTARCLKGFSTEDWSDFQARALAELANAFRVADQLGLAEDNLETAEGFFAVGTGNPELSLRLKEIRASILGARCFYTEALALLDDVYRGRRALGDRPAALRTLIKRAVFCGNAGCYETELTLLDEAARLAHDLGEEQLGIQIVHNRIYALIELNRGEEAHLLLQDHQALGTLGRVDRIRLKGLEGRIHAKLGRMRLAEQAFREAKSGFAEAGLRAHEALLSLDLATVILRQGQDRYMEAVTLAAEAVRVFSQLDIRDHVVESLLVLSDAINQGLVTAELLQSIADFVRQAEHDRRTRYVPRFG